MQNLKVIYAQFNQLGYALEPYQEQDKEALYQIFCEVIEAGTQFSYEFSTKQDFESCFFAPDSCIYVCKSLQGDVVGGFYLKPNFPGRGRHIGNAAYMIGKHCRGKGLGKLLGEASLFLAKEAGYSALQYNIVLSQNIPAVTLWKKIGFEIIGTIPQAIRNSDGTYQPAYIMYRPCPG